MDITLEELAGVTALIKQHLLDHSDRHTHNFVQQIVAENKSNMEFMWWLKMHYPEALHEWNALNKIKES